MKVMMLIQLYSMYLQLVLRPEKMAKIYFLHTIIFLKS